MNVRSSEFFVDRERELTMLEQRFSSGHAELFALFGRRRVGKTELLRQFCHGKRAVFFVADLGTETRALADFSRQVSNTLFGRPDAIGAFPSWDSALEFLSQQSTDQRIVVVFDEFTYLG